MAGKFFSTLELPDLADFQIISLMMDDDDALLARGGVRPRASSPTDGRASASANNPAAALTSPDAPSAGAVAASASKVLGAKRPKATASSSGGGVPVSEGERKLKLAKDKLATGMRIVVQPVMPVVALLGFVALLALAGYHKQKERGTWQFDKLLAIANGVASADDVRAEGDEEDEADENEPVLTDDPHHGAATAAAVDDARAEATSEFMGSVVELPQKLNGELNNAFGNFNQGAGVNDRRHGEGGENFAYHKDKFSEGKRNTPTNCRMILYYMNLLMLGVRRKKARAKLQNTLRQDHAFKRYE